MPPIAGLASLDHLTILFDISLMPSVFENFKKRNNRTVDKKMEKIRYDAFNATRYIEFSLNTVFINTSIFKIKVKNIKKNSEKQGIFNNY